MFDTEKFIRAVELQPPLYAINSDEYKNRVVKAKCWNRVGEAMFQEWSELNGDQRREEVKDLVRKWKAVRDNFVRDVRARKTAPREGEQTKSKRKYIYYDMLQFLTPHIKGSDSNCNCVQDKEDENMGQSSDGEEAAEDAPPAEHYEEEQQKRPVYNRGSPMRRKRLVTLRRTRHSMMPSATRRKHVDAVASEALSAVSYLSEAASRLQKEKASDRFGNRSFLLSFLPILDGLPLDQCLDARSKISRVFHELFATNNVYTEDYPQSSPLSVQIINSEQELE